MKFLTTFFLLTLVFAFTSCDPQSFRDCDGFDYDLSKWSIMDDTVADGLRFIDSSYQEHFFELIMADESEPYLGAAIVSSPESVPCVLTKKIMYFYDPMNLDFVVSYERFEYLDSTSEFNYCHYMIELQSGEDTKLVTKPIDIASESDLENTLEPLDKYELAGHTYYNVLRMTIDQLIVYDTRREPTVDYAAPKYIKEIVFQPPNGIVGLTLENGQQLILQE